MPDKIDSATQKVVATSELSRKGVSRRRFVKASLGAVGATTAAAVGQSASAQDPCFPGPGGGLSSPTTIVTGGVNIRSAPCTASAIVGAIPCGVSVQRLAYNDQPVYVTNEGCPGGAPLGSRRRWYQVQYGGVTGYISSAFTTEGLGYNPGCCPGAEDSEPLG